MKNCVVPDCGRKYEALGYCHSHYAQFRRTGVAPTLPFTPQTDETRFLEKVTKLPSGHWIWTGGTSSEGRYGTATFAKRLHPAHRVAWMLWRGSIPDDMVIDHLCRKTLCVNPDHLEPKSQHANILCGESPSALNAAKTHCIRGHEFTPENIQVTTHGGRQCIACLRSEEGRANARDRTRRYRERKRAQQSA